MANGYFERGEIYWVKMGGGVGMEMSVTRPALIVSADSYNTKSDLVSVVFLSLHGETCPKFVETYATGKQARILCNQIQSIDKARFTKFIAELPMSDMKLVEDALEEWFDLGYADEKALKEKDKEIEARNAVIAEKDAEIATLRAEIVRKTEEIAGRDIEIDMGRRMYNRVLDQLVDMRVSFDISRKTEKAPVVEEAPTVVTEAAPVVVVEEPVEETRVDINHCTITRLKKLGFSLPLAKEVVSRRPYKSVQDLKNVPGMKTSLFQIMEPKLCCTPVKEKVEEKLEKQPKTEEKPEIPVEKVEETRVNVNTANAHELMALGINAGYAYSITGYRKKHGEYKSLEDLLQVKQISRTFLERFRDKLEV